MLYALTFNYYNILNSLVFILDKQAKLWGMCALKEKFLDTILVNIFS